LAAFFTDLRVGRTEVFLAGDFFRAGARRDEDLRAEVLLELDRFADERFEEDLFDEELPAEEDLFADDLFAEDLFADDFRPPDLRVADFFDALFGALFRLLERDALFLRAGDLRAEDFRALFFLAPPRDDFLAAAMLRAPM
jgi:hypothetical protein